MPAESGAHAALLVCHMQRDIVENEQTLGAVFAKEALRRDVVNQARVLLEHARSADIRRVLLRIATSADGSNQLANMPLMQMQASMGALVDGEPGADVVDALAPIAGDVVVTHCRTNPFLGSDLDTILKTTRTETVIICGVATNVIVQTAAFGAADLGYQVVVAEDACSAATPEAHAAAIDTLRLVGEVSTVDVVLKRFF